ncbi:ankyrin repeat domain-containing protein [Hahella ganghwensis]|uniref:ankyrin repeat domain-containing protein n=1 Tax=Hahella ganghwensis TaxID=286420 RepID=UPI00036D3558|nr:ankyrin repeat domain-containing protein [Hahella ganghwensis]
MRVNNRFISPEVFHGLKVLFDIQSLLGLKRILKQKELLGQRLLLGLLVLSAVLFTGCQTVSREDQLAVGQVDEPTPLMNALLDQDVGRAQSLIASGSRINVVSPIGSPLDVAARSKSADGVLVLLKAGANPNIGIRNGQPSPLHHMTEIGATNAVRALAVAGAELDYALNSGATALALAIENGHLSAAKALIKAGADVNAVVNGKSLLMMVVEQNSLLMAQMLVDSGVDINFQNAEGLSALTLAQKRGFVDLQMLLLQSGART